MKTLAVKGSEWHFLWHGFWFLVARHWGWILLGLVILGAIGGIASIFDPDSPPPKPTAYERHEAAKRISGTCGDVWCQQCYPGGPPGHIPIV
jgi:hypothetical protein